MILYDFAKASGEATSPAFRYELSDGSSDDMAQAEAKAFPSNNSKWRSITPNLAFLITSVGLEIPKPDKGKGKAKKEKAKKAKTGPSKSFFDELRHVAEREVEALGDDAEFPEILSLLEARREHLLQTVLASVMAKRENGSLLLLLTFNGTPLYDFPYYQEYYKEAVGLGGGSGDMQGICAVRGVLDTLPSKSKAPTHMGFHMGACLSDKRLAGYSWGRVQNECQYASADAARSGIATFANLSHLDFSFGDGVYVTAWKVADSEPVPEFKMLRDAWDAQAVKDLVSTLQSKRQDPLTASALKTEVRVVCWIKQNTRAPIRDYLTGSHLGVLDNMVKFIDRFGRHSLKALMQATVRGNRKGERKLSQGHVARWVKRVMHANLPISRNEFVAAMDDYISHVIHGIEGTTRYITAAQELIMEVYVMEKGMQPSDNAGYAFGQALRYAEQIMYRIYSKVGEKTAKSRQRDVANLYNAFLADPNKALTALDRKVRNAAASPLARDLGTLYLSKYTDTVAHISTKPLVGRFTDENRACFILGYAATDRAIWQEIQEAKEAKEAAEASKQAKDPKVA